MRDQTSLAEKAIGQKPCNAPSRAKRSTIPMSSPERYTLRLSRQAERDIENILQYTYETYGERQRQIYADALHEAFEMITANPGLGHGRLECSSFVALLAEALEKMGHIMGHIEEGLTTLAEMFGEVDTNGL